MDSLVALQRVDLLYFLCGDQYRMAKAAERMHAAIDERLSGMEGNGQG